MTPAERQARYRKKLARPYRAKFTGNCEWHTPREYIELAREVMRGIDVDPASNALAQETVQAARFFSKEQDGLKQEWRGRLFLNPPYSQPEIGRFIAKLLVELTAGRVTQAIVLTHNSSDTAWFQKLAACATAFCFTRGRIRFVSPDGPRRTSPVQGQTFFYFGQNGGRFADVFSAIGTIVSRDGSP
jgi:DNA N-6-adenine-methyltransferase (Dam)